MRTGDADDVESVAGWVASAEPSQEISFKPARVLLQDFTGVPAVVDLAAMRDAIAELGGDSAKINPLIPSELVIDHSVQVDEFGTLTGSSSSTSARGSSRCPSPTARRSGTCPPSTARRAASSPSTTRRSSTCA